MHRRPHIAALITTTALWLISLLGCMKQTMPPGTAETRIVASVVRYSGSAEWDHFDDGTFAAYDIMTLKVLSPAPLKGRELTVRIRIGETPPESALRRANTQLAFGLTIQSLQQSQLSWSQLKSPQALP